jgi:hypothetical protein
MGFRGLLGVERRVHLVRIAQRARLLSQAPWTSPAPARGGLAHTPCTLEPGTVVALPPALTPCLTHSHAGLG